MVKNRRFLACRIRILIQTVRTTCYMIFNMRKINYQNRRIQVLTKKMFVHENFRIFRIGWRNFSDPHFWFPDHDLFVNVICNNVRIGGSRLEVLYGMLHSNFKVYLPFARSFIDPEVFQGFNLRN